ncbi:nuclear transport factor 2 family protein [Mesorhizobium loti]|uniref:nuclear transport factor 2 family protein n=1 Tax=Rhizobium loti TaxID=381 RepID=UPI0003FF4E3B|nr:nuclear transport factor 2 family protein [Mesorhizobium loti]
MNEDDAIQLMKAHAAAWNAHDVDALLALMTQDCIYDAAAGKAPSGDRHVGHEKLGKAFAAIWQAFPDACWADAEHFVCGDQGFTTWTFRGTKAGGQAIEARGVDLLRFRDGRICHKDTLRKNVPA